MSSKLPTSIANHYWIGDPLYVLPLDVQNKLLAAIEPGVAPTGLKLSLPIDSVETPVQVWYAFKGEQIYKVFVNGKYKKAIPNDSNLFIRIPLSALANVTVDNLNMGYIAIENVEPNIQNNIYRCGPTVIDQIEES